jgi:endo-1,4-beta-D-glucanase Y
MASYQWTMSPALGSYMPIAQKQIAAIWDHEVSVGSSGSLSGPLPELGDSWNAATGWPTSQGQGGINISYFAPAYYRVFATVDTSHDWMGAVDTVYSVINANLNDGQGNSTNGLVPGFSTVSGGQMNGQPASNYTYSYDSCRTPFRIGLDWCFNGETRAEEYLAKISAFFDAIGIDSIVDGYDLNGTKTGSNFTSPFFGPASVGAMSSSMYASFVQGGYTQLKKNVTEGNNNVYYDESWTTLSMLMLSGNFLDYSHLP